ncbi:hypothetical protein HK105_208692 [Polyrhizophydium stewartii]|uniref:Nuclear speckle splicing regulatory protein 1 N-terminal domain-containing protein n=1 Tax=Polyrhizophydium stewartii TaxID=2732419 RepID=A0ABR4MX66_9FUNG
MKKLAFGLNPRPAAGAGRAGRGRVAFRLGRKAAANPFAGREHVDSDEELLGADGAGPSSPKAPADKIVALDGFGGSDDDGEGGGGGGGSSAKGADGSGSGTAAPAAAGPPKAPAPDAERAAERERNRAAGKLEQRRVNAQLRAVQAQQSRAVEEAQRQALAQDPTLFDYDRAHDVLKEAELARQQKRDGDGDGGGGGDGGGDGRRKKARYVEALLRAAEKRKIELERAEERKVQRERELEGEQFGDKEMFVTEAYLQRKAELERLEAEERRREGEAGW